MMDKTQIIVLAIIQGLTEFLPISSSAHLILVPIFLHWPDQGLAFDLAVHLGTLIAVIGYFSSQLKEMLLKTFRLGFSFHAQKHNLLWKLLAATVPTAVVGFLAKDWIASSLRSELVIAFTTLFFAGLLWAADKWGALNRSQMTWKNCLWVGIAQVFALIPGTSRSGVTMTCALALGYDRKTAASFSFLLAIPIISLASGYEALSLSMASSHIAWRTLILGTGVSCVCAWICIHYFMKAIEHFGLLPFVIYRILLGSLLLILFL